MIGSNPFKKYLPHQKLDLRGRPSSQQQESVRHLTQPLAPGPHLIFWTLIELMPPVGNLVRVSLLWEE